ncbi:MAG: 5-methyltetrahydropteroyltriglutamate--homocysteine S-methyltransferase [Thermomicrobiales bacterium]
MALATIPGYPRIGKKRQLKRALESYWSGKRSAAELEAVAADVRLEAWATLRAAGLDQVPVNDFSLYDQMLDTAAMVGAIPDRFGWDGEPVDHSLYFAMARGSLGDRPAAALDMTKWFDTNYHYLAPELSAHQQFHLTRNAPLSALREAQAQGLPARPVLIGPLTFLRLSRMTDGSSPLALLDRLLPVYEEIIAQLSAAGAGWIQLDEPILATGCTVEDLQALQHTYLRLNAAAGATKLLLQVAYGDVRDAYTTLIALPIAGVGLDLSARGAHNLRLLQQHGFPADTWLAAGVIDGRNIWTADLNAALGTLEQVQAHVPADRLMVSASCSLMHVPYDVRLETHLPSEIVPWLAFAEQKLGEIATLTRGVNDGRAAITNELEQNRAVIAAAAASPLRRNAAVRQWLENLPAGATERGAPYPERAAAQQRRLQLPELPSTTIGSFPQTQDVRAARAGFENGSMSPAEYETFIAAQIAEVIARQEQIGLDVLVHGEAERNDMVQYFAEQLEGFAFTQHGWVQSYGSRCVRPPILFGDVSRPQPMTVRWATYAQSLSERPVKGMLTGPVTILNWSFVRDDQPREESCRQLALAIRAEVHDLDNAGIAIIQIDEPALREGLPLRHAEQAAYLDWAVACFRVAAAGARPATQIQTHMCYSEFGEIFDEIAALDADVLLIENARSGTELLEIFRTEGYDKGIGPGVYDIHSPRVPSRADFVAALQGILTVLPAERVWVNPDCGLKTRKPEEVWPALANMVAAALEVRAQVLAPA